MIDSWIELYGARLYGLCLTLCKSAWDADDLYQETWLRVLAYIGRYDPARDFEPWLTRICVNVYRSRLRKLRGEPVENRFATGEEKDRALEAESREDPDTLPLRQAVDALPERLRQTVILFYFRDMDLAETARALALPTGTVKSRLHQARSRLKEALQDETDLPF